MISILFLFTSTDTTIELKIEPYSNIKYKIIDIISKDSVLKSVYGNSSFSIESNTIEIDGNKSFNEAGIKEGDIVIVKLSNISDGKFNKNYNNFNNNIINNSNNIDEIFKCNLCGIKMNIKYKNDHMLCHSIDNKYYICKECGIEMRKELKDDHLLVHSLSNVGTLPKKEIKKDKDIDPIIKELLNEQEKFNKMSLLMKPKKINVNFKLVELGPSDINEFSECTICLIKFNEKEKVVKLDCTHMFHNICIDEWVKNSKNFCPVCKAKIE